MKKKRGVIEDYLIWILIAVAVLGISFIAILVMKDKGVSLIDKVNGLFKG
jgi:hypothetical protein